MILSIETATELCGVALVHCQVCIAERVVMEKNIHSERLMVLVDEMLREAKIGVGMLDGIAVSIGPGSFTGLRIGLSTAKGLAYARSLPLIAVPTLDALAYEAACVDTRGTAAAAGEIICAAVDAKRDEAYFSFYERVGTGTDGNGERHYADRADVRCIGTQTIASVSEIVAHCVRSGRVRVAGDGAKKILAAAPPPSSISDAGVRCSPVAVGLLAEQRSALLTVADYSELEPVYLRDFVTTTPRIANQRAIP